MEQNMEIEIFKQGAEARLYLGNYKGEKCLIKERFVKKYRHQELDTQITRQRMKAETKAAGRCLAAGILAPKILYMDMNQRKIFMQYFEKAITTKKFIQEKASEMIDDQSLQTELKLLCERVGIGIAKMHSNHIIHGDLTTSNILINPTTNDFSDFEVVFIDFGLSHYNQGAEDKAVDLYVLERALLSTHSEQIYLFAFILDAYRKGYGKEVISVMLKFDEVRARGRKRTMFG